MSESSITNSIVGMPGAIPIGSLLALHAARDPGRTALIIGEEQISFAELDARSTRRARMLAALGVQQGDFVTLALPNGAEIYETSFAIWKLGAVPNVVSHKLPDGELSAIVDIVRPRLVIGPDPARLPGQCVVSAGNAIDESLSAEPLPNAISPFLKAMTSGGSTGRPKVIVAQSQGVWNPDYGFIGQVPGETMLNPGPLYHNAPYFGMHAALFIGCTVVEMIKFDAERALDLIDRHKVNWINLVPTMMHRIWRLGDEARARFDLDSLRVVFHMAAPCPGWLKQAWIDWLGPEKIMELYAGTEATGSTIISGTEWLAHKGSVGKPSPGAQIRILNDEGKDCAPREVGEIYFLPDAGQGATYHYLGAEAKALGQWESLGDLGWFDEDGYLYLSDRRKDLILSGGANIYPAEVEAALDSHEEVRSSIVVGLPDDEWGQRVHAIVEADPARVSVEELIGHAARQLARYKLPKSIAFTDQPLRDDAGKARRSAMGGMLSPPANSR
jgi:bile acid-coenzyme A ligase